MEFRFATKDDIKPILKFYKDLGAVDMNEWTVYRLTKDKIDEIAGE